MTKERESLYSGVGYAIAGYFFLYVNINLGPVNILPNFVGWLLMLPAINRLQGERRDLKLLRPLAILLAVWNGVGWFLAIFGGTLDGRIPFLDILAAVAGLYFHFQFLTDMAALAAGFQGPEDDLDRRILRLRTVNTVLLTVTQVVLYLSDQSWLSSPVIVLMIADLIVMGCIVISLFALRRLFHKIGIVM